MPIRRARHGKSLLTIGAGAITLSMAGCPFVTANLIALPPQQCTAQDPLDLWLAASMSGTSPVDVRIDLLSFQVTGTELADLFNVEGGVKNNVVFSAGSLAASTSVTVTVTPDSGATRFTIHTGATCNGVARPIDVVVDTVSQTATLKDAG